MKKLKNIIVCIVALIAMAMSGCMPIQMARLADNVDIIGVEQIELKGLTGLMIDVKVSNNSRLDISMNRASLTIIKGGEAIATLSQVGEATSLARTTESVSTVWRIESVNPLSLLSLSGRILNRDFSGITVDYSADLSAGKISRSISGKDVDLTNLMVIFAQ